ncbi:MAG: hypothetical protein ACKVI5_07925 [Nitrospinaceae bacterium]
MKVFYWAVFGLFLLTFSGFYIREVIAAPKYRDIGLTSSKEKKISTQKTILTSKEETDGLEQKVLVIKQAEIKSLVSSIKREYETYIGIEGFQLEKKITGKTASIILTIDKPLVLGGDGFNKASFDSIEHKARFTFYSHIKPKPVYESEKDIAHYIDPTLEGARNEKFLIFHDSDLSFGREPSIFVEPIPKQFLKKKVTYIKVRPILETKIYLGLNSKAKVNLSPAQKPLDLIQGNPAVLKYDYRKLSSNGS